MKKKWFSLWKKEVGIGRSTLFRRLKYYIKYLKICPLLPKYLCVKDKNQKSRIWINQFLKEKWNEHARWIIVLWLYPVYNISNLETAGFGFHISYHFERPLYLLCSKYTKILLCLLRYSTLDYNIVRFYNMRVLRFRKPYTSIPPNERACVRRPSAIFIQNGWPMSARLVCIYIGT